MIRQPARPKRPSQYCRIAPATGAPRALEAGSAIMNSPVSRTRTERGNQKVRYSMIPGKNPASAMPSRTRNA
ncbi:unannotated protein [freshwater metagenome]|uniref:Unannotated protein n=1 Tax=freshwater metagenome TaxID=449393 RepID=A0A6J7GRZ1_9ZZZZ